MILNFTEQILLVKNNLSASSAATADFWQDDNKEKFYDSYMNGYEDKLDLFIHGGPGVYGMGLEELLMFIRQKEREMEMLRRQ